MQRHAIIKDDLCSAVYTALAKGRGKYRNTFIHGDTNCGKSFILSPLKVIYKTFFNSATRSFAWLGAEDAEIIFLKDFHWHLKIIALADFLQALEGDTVHLPALKSVCCRDLELNKASFSKLHLIKLINFRCNGYLRSEEAAQVIQPQHPLQLSSHTCFFD